MGPVDQSGAYKSCFITPPPEQDREEYDKRLMGQDKDRERSLTSYRHGQNRLNLGKLIYHQSNLS